MTYPQNATGSPSKRTDSTKKIRRSMTTCHQPSPVKRRKVMADPHSPLAHGRISGRGLDALDKPRFHYACKVGCRRVALQFTAGAISGRSSALGVEHLCVPTPSAMNSTTQNRSSTKVY